MKSERFDAALVRTAGIAVIIAASVVTWAHLRRPNLESPEYAQGDVFGTVSGVDFVNAPATLVVWVDSRCHFCTESMDFYRSLIAAPRRTRIILMGAQPKQVLADYATRNGLRPDDVVSAPAFARKLTGTPRLILVGVDSRVIAMWRGRLPAGGKEEADIKGRL